MGNGKYRNKPCPCGSGKKFKDCHGNDPDRKYPKFPDFIPLKNGAFLKTLRISNDEEYMNLGEKGMWYSSIASVDEARRIINIRNSNDYFLKMRADLIIDNMRIYRTFIKQRNFLEEKGKKWALEEQLESDHFTKYLSIISKENSNELKKLTAGYIYCTEPNGMAIPTKYGNIITVSESYRQSLYYMNLYMLDFSIEIPYEIRWFALVIAIRIYLNNESLDFNLDPRGNIPKTIDNTIKKSLLFESLFIIGHEYSHHSLGHLNKTHTLKMNNNKKEYVVYSNSQKEELEADIQSIKRVIDKFDQYLIFHNALTHFTTLAFFEHAKNQIYPSINYLPTHPSAIDRIKNLIKSFPELCENSPDKLEKYHLDFIDKTIEKLTYDISINIDKYEFYGSVYLGEWKKNILVDRIDY